MGQKTNPISNRIGITRGWVSNWCGGNYAEKIAEDYKIRKYLVNRLANASISKIVIEFIYCRNNVIVTSILKRTIDRSINGIKIRSNTYCLNAAKHSSNSICPSFNIA